MKEIEEHLFVELTPLGFEISVTHSYWEYITTIKHPYMKSMKSEVIITLKNPDSIRQSKVDNNVYLFYRKIEYNNKNYHMVCGNK